MKFRSRVFGLLFAGWLACLFGCFACRCPKALLPLEGEAIFLLLHFCQTYGLGHIFLGLHSVPWVDPQVSESAIINMYKPLKINRGGLGSI